MESIIEEIIRIIEEVADIPQDEISAESKFIDDLDLASLEIMSVVSALEKKYNIKLAENELLSVSSVEELAKIVESK